jgi:heme exporter protein B|tara:strand:+ start:1152 stop:1814 length:663 start_codon:yes stop_codon:yes gene_type:complete
VFTALLRKDLTIEFRSKEIIISMITFGVAVILLYALAFRQSPEAIERFSPGLLWMVFLFIAAMGVHRAFSLEKEFDAFGMLLSAPVDRSIIFLSKWVSGFIFILVSQLVVVPLFLLFLQVSPPANLAGWIGIFILTDLGITALGSLVSGIVMRVRMSEILLPLLLFPLITPLLIAAVKSTDALMIGLQFTYWKIWPQIIVTFVIAFGVLGYIIFDFVSEE